MTWQKLTNRLKTAANAVAGGGNGEDAEKLLPEVRKFKPHTLCGTAALNNLFRQARQIVDQGIPGAVVECGVCNGGSAAAIALGFGNSLTKLWLYDSFQGLPSTAPADGEDAKAFIGRCVGSPEKVKEVFNLTGLPETCLEIRKGWFADTFTQPLPGQVAFLHIDADWYDSVLLTLTTFYDRIPDGGVIVLDDFGWWEGCREAFYDFCHRREIKPLLERCGAAQAYWIKSKAHNRDWDKSAMVEFRTQKPSF